MIELIDEKSEGESSETEKLLGFRVKEGMVWNEHFNSWTVPRNDNMQKAVEVIEELLKMEKATDMNALVLHADLTKHASSANRTLDLTFNTSFELTAEGLGLTLSYLNVTGTLAFKIGDFTDGGVEALPEYKPEFASSKSPSER